VYVSGPERCERCERGREACQWCETVSERDWEAMCDCGLLDFGGHLLNCAEREGFRYVVAIDHEAALLSRH
jgi:hypothetical protein